jgi:hypothetical protein
MDPNSTARADYLLPLGEDNVPQHFVPPARLAQIMIFLDALYAKMSGSPQFAGPALADLNGGPNDYYYYGKDLLTALKGHKWLTKVQLAHHAYGDKSDGVNLQGKLATGYHAGTNPRIEQFAKLAHDLGWYDCIDGHARVFDTESAYHVGPALGMSGGQTAGLLPPDDYMEAASASDDVGVDHIDWQQQVAHERGFHNWGRRQRWLEWTTHYLSVDSNLPTWEVVPQGRPDWLGLRFFTADGSLGATHPIRDWWMTA